MRLRGRGLVWTVGTGLALAVGASALSGAAAPDPADANRYPYDPVCAWGRVGDGNGMLVRCLSEQEAKRLGAGAPAPAATRPPLEPKDAAIPVDAGDGAPMQPPRTEQHLVVSVGPIKVDTGALPQAVGKLSRPKDRYVTCVQEHGGLSAARGEVEVRFMVRGRGRAEGVSVARRRGMSADAAKCVADVVDRRHVGIPEAPIVGATLTIAFDRQ